MGGLQGMAKIGQPCWEAKEVGNDGILDVEVCRVTIGAGFTVTSPDFDE